MDQKAAERVLLNEGGVRVTPSRVDVGGKTYAMRNITSVQVRAPGWGGGSLLMVIGGAIATLSGVWQGQWGLSIPAALVTGLGFYMGARDSRRRTIMLGSSSGEAEALTTSDPAFAERVHSAIVDAMGAR